MSQEPKVTRFGASPLIDSELATKAYVDAGGGSGLTCAKVVKTVDETIQSSTTLQDDDELKFTPSINTVYFVQVLLFLTSAQTADFKHAVSIPAGATARRNETSWQLNDQNSQDWTVENTPSTTNQLEMIQLLGRLVMGATAGDFVVQWAQFASQALDTTVNRGSLLLAWEEGTT